MKSIDLISTYNFISLTNFEKYLFNKNYAFLYDIEENEFNYIFDKIPIFDSIFFELNNSIFKQFFKIENIK
jgi:hypothetical protein